MNLNIKICPGCGTVDPASCYVTHFECVNCHWEIDFQLPTIREIMDTNVTYNGVELGSVLNSLLGRTFKPKLAQ